jgi:uncharacterized protein (DUF2141 family)
MTLWFFLLPFFFLPSTTKTSDVKLRIEGLQKTKGEIRIAIFNSKANYTKEPFALAVVPVTSKVVEWRLPELLYGEYAIAVYHDENTNAKLDTNLVGAPVEPYGFSNNARGLFGPPSWESARIEVNESMLTISILLK